MTEFTDRAIDSSRNPDNLEHEWKVLCEELNQSTFCPLLVREYRAAGKIADAKALASRRCGKAETESCIELGKTLYSEGAYGEADPYLKSACEGKNPETCEWAGLVAAGLKDHTRALNHFRRGCSAGVESACYYQGRTLRTKGRNDEATGPLRKACDSGKTGACSELGIILWQSGKLDAGLKLFQTDCEKKVHRACRWLPLLERKLMPPSPQKKPLETILEQDCKKNQQLDACYDLTTLQFLRKGGRDLALYGWKENCKAGHSMSCWEVHLEESFEDADPIQSRDTKTFCNQGVLIACYYEAAQELLRGNTKEAYTTASALCEKGEPWSCHLAAQNPLLRDEDRDPLVKRACELGLKDDCPGTTKTEDIEITVGSPATASDDPNAQCESGTNAEACGWIGFEALKTDPEKAKKNLEKACQERSVYSCRLYRDLLK